ncbi:MAG: ferrous iron transport protein B [Chloroflexi bacterium RBG_16_48_8]|nr:MAG: ferrous iron transport protein B [Chloroflexi bacterium RBG_16_48_8]
MQSNAKEKMVHHRDGKCIALVGQPNVGKSVIFQALTGRYVTVANYPGTTVELTRGAARDIPGATVIDTPGVITLPPHTEDEFVTANVLLNEPLSVIVQVGDAKNLRRTLMLTIQLAEMGVPMALALNMMDEAVERGVSIDHGMIEEQMDVPVIPTVAIHGEGIEELIEETRKASPHPFHLQYPIKIERSLEQIEILLPPCPISKRAIALLWMSDDPVVQAWLEEHAEPEILQKLHRKNELLKESFEEAPSTVIYRTRFDYVDRLTKLVQRETGSDWQSLAATLGKLSIHPLWGMIILAFILYGMYWFVGVFSAGTLVGLLEEKLFGQIINPWVTNTLARFIPVPFISDLLVGEYGLWSMGMTYALALILPIVTTFFIAFSILEDSGYLPRLAVLTNRLFRIIGLNGKAVLPMVLGLGCVTMATLTTRVLETKRDRLLVILLLALAVPCSAQLGVVMGMLASVSLTATLIWAMVVLGVLLLVGWIAAKVVPGERTSLLLELPPIRWPMLSSVLTKTLVRLEWYTKEVVPLFLLGAAIMFTMDKVGLLTFLTDLGEPLVKGWLGLPPEASAAFLLGFMRRDFGATSLFLMSSNGLLNPSQVVVSMVTITLFVPCIAALLMIAKSRGWRTMLAMVAVIFPLAFIVGGLLNLTLQAMGWGS